VELQGAGTIAKRTGTVSLLDLRINGFQSIERMTRKPIEVASGVSSGQRLEMYEDVSSVEKWDHPGDSLPELISWARSQWGDDLENLPNRLAFLNIFRERFGRILGINEKTMAKVRAQSAPDKARRGELQRIGGNLGSS